MSFNKETFCKNLCRLRKLKGYNKYEMSIQANMSYSYYVDIENGKLIPNFKCIVAIANALNTSINDLISEHCNTKINLLKTEILVNLRKRENKVLLKKIYEILLSIKTWSDIEEDTDV